MKKVRKVLTVLVVLALLTGTVYAISTVSINVIGRKPVEQYCSTAYQHSVDEYKACKKLNAIQLIDSLKQDIGNKYEVPDLKELKF